MCNCEKTMSLDLKVSPYTYPNIHMLRIIIEKKYKKIADLYHLQL